MRGRTARRWTARLVAVAATTATTATRPHVGPSPASAGWNFQASGTGGGHAVACPTTTHCWAVEDGGRILATTDGGATWTAQASGVAATYAFQDIACPTTLLCWAVGGNTNPADGIIVATADGGATWTTQLTPPVRMFGVGCATTTHCWAVGFGGIIRATANGGTTWTAQPSGITTNLHEVSCPTATHCFASTNSGMRVTSDGGTTWTGQNVPGSPFLNGVSCFDVLRCWVAGTTNSGSSGVVARTTNGGSTWTVHNSGSAATLSDVSCPSLSQCWAVGDGGTVRATTDGGVTWAGQALGTLDWLRGVSCPTTTRCWAVAADSDIYALAPPAPPTITQAPPDPSGNSTAEFWFSGERAATFECSLDASSFTACSSPKRYGDLATGRHTFQVRQIDELGQVSPPASYSWTIDCGIPGGICPPEEKPTTPMALIEISAPTGASAPTVTRRVLAPDGWNCPAQPSWDPVTGVASLICTPPTPEPGFVNVCGWLAVNVQTVGFRGDLYGEASCTDDDDGAVVASAPANGALSTNSAAKVVNRKMTRFACIAQARPDQGVRPWTVLCTNNH